jgi:ubiquinol-cytochrome c reductase cytochrome c subunit
MLGRLQLGLVLAASGLVVAAETAAVEERAGEKTPEETRAGRAEFVEMGCYQCHGYEGQGARGTGPRIAPDPLPLEIFSNIVRRPPDVMPAYSPNVLSEGKLKRIHDYLVSVPEPPDVSSLPAFDEN